MEYIRDVYAELVAMGEGARRPGDRSDISSDEEDEMEVLKSIQCFVPGAPTVQLTCACRVAVNRRLYRTSVPVTLRQLTKSKLSDEAEKLVLLGVVALTNPSPEL